MYYFTLPEVLHSEHARDTVTTWQDRQWHLLQVFWYIFEIQVSVTCYKLTSRERCNLQLARKRCAMCCHYSRPYNSGILSLWTPLFVTRYPFSCLCNFKMLLCVHFPIFGRHFMWQMSSARQELTLWRVFYISDNSKCITWLCYVSSQKI